MDFDLLALFYGIVCFIYVIKEIIFIRKIKKIPAISYTRLIYALIYGLVPAIIYSNRNLDYIDYSSKGITQGLVLLLLSVIGYASICFGYWIKQKEHAGKPVYEINNLFLSGLVILLLGLVSYLLWSRVYGSPFAVLKYANAIRAGFSNIDNPLAFLQHPSSLLLFSSYIFFALIHDPKYNKFLTIFFFAFSAFWSIIYLIATDGRMSFVLYFLVFLLYEIVVKEKGGRKTRQNLILVGVLFVGAFVMMALSDYILRYIQIGSSSSVTASEGVVSLVSNELGYTVLSGQTALTALQKGMAGNKLFMDLSAGFFAWIPSRFKPGGIMPLSAYNTLLVSSYGPGGNLPTEILSMSLYDLDYFGVIIIPLILGLLIKKIDNSFSKKQESKYYRIMYLAVSLRIAIRAIAYADFESIALSFFYIIVGHVIVKLLSKMHFAEKRLK